MFQVNHSKEDEIDVERIDIHPSSSPSASASGSGNNDIIIVPDGAEDSTMIEGVNDDDTTINQGSHGTTSFMSKLFNKKTAAATCVLGLAAVLGVSINGAAEYKQQQNALAAINGIGGKAGKAISFCEPEEVMTCGQLFENTKVVLSEDLFCTDDVNDASKAWSLPKFNAAIRIKGPDAVLDCKKHTISQRSSKNAAYCAETFNQSNRRDAKMSCDLFYQVGIHLVDGATAVNCKVEHFQSGIYIGQGGEVKKSEVSGNRNGLNIRDEVTTGSTTKVKDL